MPVTLAVRLHADGIDPSDVIAHRIALHPEDADEIFSTTANLADGNHALTYERIQDGAVFGAHALVAAFVAQADGSARFVALRKLTARRAGSAPGDIVYDPEIAHLLHNFISRAKKPTFYDASEDARGEHLRDSVIAWPAGTDDVLRADDDRLRLIAGRD